VPDENKRQLLRSAATRLGTEALADALKVPEPLLRAWMDGHATMPDRKFLALADLLETLSNPPKA
jgi:hypothetical protein